jgi:hypothetical protein
MWIHFGPAAWGWCGGFKAQQDCAIALVALTQRPNATNAARLKTADPAMGSLPKSER